ncbi:MAG: hypothetical protein KJO01_12220 [Gammaproteobacteria bacterium]|nr:hypothetical protein [Gammaproteobacteria bacterium]MBT8110533.1 hypothetical protein [Gammaproteobacteria bacterium]NND47481.1 hypothetical protein [Woeseiaceae bacterium]NNL45233.1 hypothetical protein [Woeseiaceae bacterium]
MLVGEVMGFDGANNISHLVGYFDRDYGKSALFANKNVVIDASISGQSKSIIKNVAVRHRLLFQYRVAYAYTRI